MANYFYDDAHIRYELAASHAGAPYNWLFLPGGPGADSCYFRSFTDQIKLPGNSWFIDFPGNGSNIKNLKPSYDYELWLELLLPMVKKFENPVIVGHSFGGMLPLLFPELESYLKGFVVLNSAPSLWLEEAVVYAKKFNLPDLTREMEEFTKSPNEHTFRVALDACIPYYFPAKSLEKGRALLAKVPFQFLPAGWWQQKVAELNFSAKWVPKRVPTLLISGSYDCICPYYLFQRDERFTRPNIRMVNFEDAGHMPWVDNPEGVKKALNQFCDQLDRISS